MTNKINFTPREQEVLNQIKKGKQRKIIADALGMAISTLDKHVNRIHVKTGTHAMAELIIWLQNNHR